MLKELQEHQVRFTGHIESSFGWREGLLSILQPLILFSMLFSYGARRIVDGVGQPLTSGKTAQRFTATRAGTRSPSPMWPAFWGALIISIVSAVLNLLIGEDENNPLRSDVS